MLPDMQTASPFKFHSELAWSLGSSTTAEQKRKQADGAARNFLSLELRT